MAMTLDHPRHRHRHVLPARLLAIAVFILVVICATAAPFRSAAADVGSAAAALMGPDAIATVVSTVVTAFGVAWLYLKNLAH